jgi:probable F420-dependent oxidoreductase
VARLGEESKAGATMSREAMRQAGIDPGTIGIWTWTFDRAPAEASWRQMQLAEELGYGAVWVPEVMGKEALTHAAVLLAGTSRIVVANGIARIQERSPRATAAGQQTLSDAYPGRYLLGLGVGGGGERPIAALRRYLDEMDTVQVLDGNQRPWPRILAAHGLTMLRLAHERATGAHTYKVPVAHTREARQVLGPEPFLAVEQAVLLEHDAGRARALAREHLAGYVHSQFNRAKFRRLGYSEEELAGGGRDRFVDDLVAWGSLERIAERVRAHLEAGADHVALQVLTGEGSASLEGQWESLAKTLMVESEAAGSPPLRLPACRVSRPGSAAPTTDHRGCATQATPRNRAPHSPASRAHKPISRWQWQGVSWATFDPQASAYSRS